MVIKRRLGELKILLRDFSPPECANYVIANKVVYRKQTRNICKIFENIVFTSCLSLLYDSFARFHRIRYLWILIVTKILLYRYRSYMATITWRKKLTSWPEVAIYSLWKVWIMVRLVWFPKRMNWRSELPLVLVHYLRTEMIMLRQHRVVHRLLVLSVPNTECGTIPVLILHRKRPIGS